MVRQKREAMENIVKSHYKLAIPDSLSRDAGLIDPDEK
jgi:hypothetical protein